jgi:hypothetical protein
LPVVTGAVAACLHAVVLEAADRLREAHRGDQMACAQKTAQLQGLARYLRENGNAAGSAHVLQPAVITAEERRQLAEIEEAAYGWPVRLLAAPDTAWWPVRPKEDSMSLAALYRKIAESAPNAAVKARFLAVARVVEKGEDVSAAEDRLRKFVRVSPQEVNAAMIAYAQAKAPRHTRSAIAQDVLLKSAPPKRSQVDRLMSAMDRRGIVDPAIRAEGLVRLAQLQARRR